MRPTIIIAAVCGIAAPTAPAFAVDDPSVITSGTGASLRCKRKNPAGKLFSKRVCRTETEWAAMRAEAADPVRPNGVASTLPVAAVSFR